MLNKIGNNITTNTSTMVSSFVHGEYDKVICCSGTWDGATITIQVSPDGGTTWIDVDHGAYTDDFVKRVSLCYGMKIRGTVSNAGASTDLSVWIGE